MPRSFMTFMFTEVGPLRRQGRRRWRNAGVAGDAALFWRTPGGRHGTAWLGGAATYKTYHFGVFFFDLSYSIYSRSIYTYIHMISCMYILCIIIKGSLSKEV